MGTKNILRMGTKNSLRVGYSKYSPGWVQKIFSSMGTKSILRDGFRKYAPGWVQKIFSGIQKKTTSYRHNMISILLVYNDTSFVRILYILETIFKAT